MDRLLTIKVGIVGGTGYTGSELLRLLALHPDCEIRVITSRGEAGRSVADLFPNLRGHLDVTFTEPSVEHLQDCDVVFFATPNGTAMQQTPVLLNSGVRVIDLAADFRIPDANLWSAWYGMEHACPELLGEAVYGLPELYRDQIKTARLVANPGCYPTAATLGFLPLIESGVIDSDSLIADCKSGASGAGRGASVGVLHSEIGESFKAYGVSGHRHLPEIAGNLGRVLGRDVDLTFVPHLLPMIRGIEATLYAQLVESEVDVQALFERRYADEPFVDVMPAGSLPDTRSVRGVNWCRIAVHQPVQASRSAPGRRIVVLSVIDNLVKGAAGQAVQNMNIMFGLNEKAGLNAVALAP